MNTVRQFLRRKYSEDGPTSSGIRDQVAELLRRPAELFLKAGAISPVERAERRLERIRSTSSAYRQQRKSCLVGKHCNWPDDMFDPEELEKGIEIEREHTGDYETAKEIAKDHLVEIPDYYTRLIAMEKESRSSGEEWKRLVDRLKAEGRSYGHIVDAVQRLYPNVTLEDFEAYMGNAEGESHAVSTVPEMEEEEKKKRIEARQKEIKEYLRRSWGTFSETVRNKLLTDAGVPNPELAKEYRFDKLPHGVINSLDILIERRVAENPYADKDFIIPKYIPKTYGTTKKVWPYEEPIKNNISHFFQRHWKDLTVTDRENIIREAGFAGEEKVARYRWELIHPYIRNEIVRHYTNKSESDFSTSSDGAVIPSPDTSEERWWERGHHKATVICPRCKNKYRVKSDWQTFVCYDCGRIIERETYERHKGYMEHDESHYQTSLLEVSDDAPSAFASYVTKNWRLFNDATRLRLLNDAGVKRDELSVETDWYALPEDVRADIIELIKTRAVPGATIEQVVPIVDKGLEIPVPGPEGPSSPKRKLLSDDKFIQKFFVRYWRGLTPEKRATVIQNTDLPAEKVVKEDKWECLSPEARSRIIEYYLKVAASKDFSGFDFDNPDYYMFIEIMGLPMSDFDVSDSESPGGFPSPDSTERNLYEDIRKENMGEIAKTGKRFIITVDRIPTDRTTYQGVVDFIKWSREKYPNRAGSIGIVDLITNKHYTVEEFERSELPPEPLSSSDAGRLEKKKECPMCTAICNSLGDVEWCKTQFAELRDKKISDKELADRLDRHYGKGWENRILQK